MSTSALRAVRELRGEDAYPSRPGTSSGRPGTSSGLRVQTPEDSSAITTAAANNSAAATKEIEELRAALEKEKRSVRALESYLTDVSSAKDAELKDLALEVRNAQQDKQRAEDNQEKMEEMYKTQISKLVGQVEKLQSKPATAREAEEAFSTVLREEMRAMQQSFQLKLEKAQQELQSKSSEWNKQIRSLNESLVEERKKNQNLMEKLARAPMSPTNGSTSASTPASSTSSSTTAASSKPPVASSSSSSTAAKPSTSNPTKPTVKATPGKK